MNFTKELIEKAKTARSAEELLEMATAENMELSAADAAKAFAELHKSGELADEELDHVSGGCSNPSPDGKSDTKEGVVFLYDVGQQVEIIDTFGTTTAVITSRNIIQDLSGGYYPYYVVTALDGSDERSVDQDEIQIP